MPEKSARGGSVRKDSPETERRSNLALRDILNDLIEHVREIAGSRDKMPPAEIEYAQRRLEWLADEAWRLAVDPENGAWQ
jgi:hypothetical protein